MSATEQAYYSISDLMERWRRPSSTIYNWLRGQRVLDFAGRKGCKMVPAEVVREIEEKHTRVYR